MLALNKDFFPLNIIYGKLFREYMNFVLHDVASELLRKTVGLHGIIVVILHLFLSSA
jgi:hypothetical protein